MKLTGKHCETCVLIKGTFCWEICFSFMTATPQAAVLFFLLQGNEKPWTGEEEACGTHLLGTELH